MDTTYLSEWSKFLKLIKPNIAEDRKQLELSESSGNNFISRYKYITYIFLPVYVWHHLIKMTQNKAQKDIKNMVSSIIYNSITKFKATQVEWVNNFWYI